MLFLFIIFTVSKKIKVMDTQSTIFLKITKPKVKRKKTWFKRQEIRLRWFNREPVHGYYNWMGGNN